MPTKAEIQEALDRVGVEYPSDARKDELEEAARGAGLLDESGEFVGGEGPEEAVAAAEEAPRRPKNPERNEPK